MPRAVVLLEFVALAGLAAGAASTWPLWTAPHSFPQIPWCQWVVHAPPLIDGLLLAAAVIAGLFVPAARLASRGTPALTGAKLVFSLAAGGLLLLDQHRLQPWAYHLLVVLLLLWLSPDARGLTFSRGVVLSIYVHSAVSRFDRASLELQWELLAALLERLGIAGRLQTDAARLRIAAAPALAELAVALLLFLSPTRRYGRWGSVLMHAMFVLALGPLGLDHYGGVLAWNVVWIAQNVVLFSPQAATGSSPAAGRRRYRAATLLAVFVIAAPLLEPWGLWDHWPSWRLYSARPARITVFIEAGTVVDLPREIQPFVGPPEPLTDWCPLHLEAWSFAALRCPMYPQQRFELAVIAAVVRRARLDEGILVVVETPPDRLTGRRERFELHGRRAIEDACGQYWVNVRSRPGGE